MNMHKPAPWLFSFVLALLAAHPLAQDPAGGGTAAGEIQRIYTQLVRTPLLPVRPPADIQRDLELAREDLLRVEKAQENSRLSLEKVRGNLSAVENELIRLKPAIETAKKEKREEDKSMMEKEKKQAEQLRDFLQECLDLYLAEMEWADASRLWVQSRQEAYQAENELVARLAEREQAGLLEAMKAGLSASAAQDKALQTAKIMVNQGKEAAERAKKVVEKRLNLAEKLRKMAGSMN